ncbi:hypothetical protein GA0115254_118575 [Streptomyces sp. Ncost-T10-10d]|nr:hypothetical protein GA0115254_118575 [Streptomyces sp. Ncost-T10-10d]
MDPPLPNPSEATAADATTMTADEEAAARAVLNHLRRAQGRRIPTMRPVTT